ncbi:MAG: DUF5320 domain-containing protein [bacterium]
MPFRDGTGPLWGNGPGAGFRGRMSGGYCPYYGPRVSKKDYLEMLKQEKKALEEEIKELENAKAA